MPLYKLNKLLYIDKITKMVNNKEKSQEDEECLIEML